jgi:hypothetical protein
MWFWKTISVLLLSFYFIYALSKIFSLRILSQISMALFEICLIILGLIKILVGDVDAIIRSIIYGLLYLPLMVALTSPSVKYFFSFRYQFCFWLKSIFRDFKLYIPILYKTFREELIWRSSLVFLLRFFHLNQVVIFIIGSILFYSIHFNKNAKIVLLTEIELLLFSCLLYVVYLEYNSFLTVWLIHFIRNSYLYFYRSVIKNV